VSPGRKIFTRIMPTTSDISDALTNQPIVLRPIRPSDDESPICADADYQRGEHERAIIILISAKISVNREMYPATVFAVSGLGEAHGTSSRHRFRPASLSGSTSSA
jgi:hypothetical protein